MNGDRLGNALDKWWVKAEQKQFLYGTVGRVNPDNTVTIVVPQRPDFVYVVMTDSTLAQARNQRRVPLRSGLPVKMRRENGTLVILEEDRTGLLENDPNAPGTVYSVNGQTGDVLLDFIDLTDVPTAYTGHANKVVAVKVAEDGLEFITNASDVAAAIVAAADKPTPVDADLLALVDSAASFVLKQLTWANLKATLKVYLDTLYLIVAGKAGGQTASGGIAASENLIFDSTVHATKGVIGLQPAGGHVGIGTSTPGVDVVGTTDITNVPLLQVDGANPRLVLRGSADAGLNLIDTGAGSNVKWMRLLTDAGFTEFQSVADAGTVQADNILVMDHSTGKVGFGTATPQVLTHLVSSAVAGATYNAGDPLTIERNASSNINIITGTANNGGVIFSDADARARGAFFYSHADDALIYWTAGTEKARITSVGNVGIGTAAPGVDVVGTTDITSTPLLQLDGATPRMVIRGSTDAGLNLIDTGAGANLKWMRLITDAGLTEFQSVADAGTLQVDNILVLDHNLGQVMIGTATPVAGAELTVAGDVSVSGKMSANILESSNWYSLGFGHHLYSDGGSPELMVLGENGRLGLGGASVPSDMIHVNGTAVALRLGETNDYTRWSYVSAAQSIVESFRSAGDMILDTNLHPGDGTGICTVRFFRATNTTGQARVQVLKGNNTSTVNCQLAGNTNSYLNADSGSVGVGITAPTGKLHVSQPSTTAAIPTLWLRQADESEEFIRFETTVAAGNPINTTALGTYYGRARVHVNGVGEKWIALYNT